MKLLDILILVFFMNIGQMSSAYAVESLKWDILDKGIAYCEINDSILRSVSTNGAREEIKIPLVLQVIRINPSINAFDLYSSSLENLHNPINFTLPQWAEKKELLVAINASMYLKNGLTSTGYMRKGNWINNSRIGSKLGAFFVSKPRKKNLPQVDILEQTTPDLEKKLSEYEVVIQNFRIIGNYNSNSKRPALVWKGNDKSHAISAVGIDVNGNILFLQSALALTISEFGQYLLSDIYPELNLKTVMYTEGGTQASLYINTEKKKKLWSGSHIASLLFFSGQIEVPLPNIIGVKKNK